MSAILALAAILLTAAAATRVAFNERAPSLVDRALRAAVGTAIGFGLWSATYAGALLLFGPRARLPKDALLAAAGAALLFTLPVGNRQAATPRLAAPRWLWVAFGIAASTAVAVFIHDTWQFPDGGYDAFQIWNLRARFLARGGNGFGAAFSPQMESWAHQDYPWLVPGLVAQGFLVLGNEYPLVPITVAASFGVLAVAIPMLSLARLRGTRWGLLAAIVLLTTPCFPVFASHQESDVPLGVYVCATVALLILAEEDHYKRGALVWLAGLSAGLGAWTKNEGILYILCFVAAFLLRRHSARVLGWFIAGALPLLALVVYFKGAFAPPNDLVRFSTIGGAVSRALDPFRWAHLVVLTARRIVYFQDFALWVVAEVLVLAMLLRRIGHSTAATALLLSCPAYALIYVLQPHPLDWLYAHSVERIFIQLWPAAVLITLLVLSKDAQQASVIDEQPRLPIGAGHAARRS